MGDGARLFRMNDADGLAGGVILTIRFANDPVSRTLPLVIWRRGIDEHS